MFFLGFISLCYKTNEILLNVYEHEDNAMEAGCASASYNR